MLKLWIDVFFSAQAFSSSFKGQAPENDSYLGIELVHQACWPVNRFFFINRLLVGFVWIFCLWVALTTKSVYRPRALLPLSCARFGSPPSS